MQNNVQEKSPAPAPAQTPSRLIRASNPSSSSLSSSSESCAFPFPFPAFSLHFSAQILNTCACGRPGFAALTRGATSCSHAKRKREIVCQPFFWGWREGESNEKQGRGRRGGGGGAREGKKRTKRTETNTWYSDFFAGVARTALTAPFASTATSRPPHGHPWRFESIEFEWRPNLPLFVVVPQGQRVRGKGQRGGEGRRREGTARLPTGGLVALPVELVRDLVRVRRRDDNVRPLLRDALRPVFFRPPPPPGRRVSATLISPELKKGGGAHHSLNARP